MLLTYIKEQLVAVCWQESTTIDTPFLTTRHHTLMKAQASLKYTQPILAMLSFLLMESAFHLVGAATINAVPNQSSGNDICIPLGCPANHAL